MGISLDTAEQDFAAAYDAYADAIFRHTVLRVFDRERAKDILHDSFCKMWEYVAQGNSIEHVQAFLYRTANNLIVDEARRRARRHERSLEEMQEGGFDIQSDEDVSKAGLRIEEERALKVLYQLEDQYRDVLILRYIDGMPPAEIAALLGESANAVSVRINRAMAKLRTLLPDG